MKVCDPRVCDPSPRIEELSVPHLASHEKPRIALHLMVKNGASVVGRLLDCVGPYVEEAVVVLNDTTDDTQKIISSKIGQFGLSGIKRATYYEVTRENHPEWYILDVPETYQTGRSLAGEFYNGPFTGVPILANWAAARNVGWEGDPLSDWRLFLDADDLVDNPEHLPELCAAFDRRGIDVVAAPYHYYVGIDGRPRVRAFRERLARNTPKRSTTKAADPWVADPREPSARVADPRVEDSRVEDPRVEDPRVEDPRVEGFRIVWTGCVHEILTGYDPARVACVDGNERSLVVRDLRDSTGADTRIPGRNLKILYQHARSINWDLSPREMVYLGMEARKDMPKLAHYLFEKYCQVSTWNEEAAWACSMNGELWEAEKNFEMACVWYERGLCFHPSPSAAFRLARSNFFLRKWAATIDAYETGIANQHPQLLDADLVNAKAIEILVVQAHHELGHIEQVKTMVAKLTKSFPNVAALEMFTRSLLNVN